MATLIFVTANDKKTAVNLDQVTHVEPMNSGNGARIHFSSPTEAGTLGHVTLRCHESVDEIFAKWGEAEAG